MMRKIKRDNYELHVEKYLIEKNMNHGTYCYLGVLLIDSIVERNFDNLKKLISEGADIHFSNDHPLTIAISYNNYEIVEYLVNSGANINAEGKNFLLKAVYTENISMIKLLANNGIDLFTKKEAAFKHSLKIGNLEIILFFIENGHDINLALKRSKSKIKKAISKYKDRKELFEKLDQEITSNNEKKSLRKI